MPANNFTNNPYLAPAGTDPERPRRSPLCLGISLVALLMAIPVMQEVVFSSAIPFILDGTLLPLYFYVLLSLELCIVCGLVYSSLCWWFHRILAGTVSLASAVFAYQYGPWLLNQLIPP